MLVLIRTLYCIACNFFFTYLLLDGVGLRYEFLFDEGGSVVVVLGGGIENVQANKPSVHIFNHCVYPKEQQRSPS